MTSPLSSISKNRKTPLFFPEMSTPSPLPREPEKTSRLGINSGYSFIPSVPSQTSSSNFDSLPSIKSNLNDAKNHLIPFKSYIDDSDLIDEFTTQMAVNNLKKKNPSSKNPNAPNDLELMQLMMSKIKQTENKCAILEREITRKDKKIEILEEKLDLYKKKKIESRDDVIEDLEQKNYQLMKQISEMEVFLADYGLHWVGSTTSNPSSESKNEQIKSIEEPDGFKVDFDLMIKNVTELNSLMDSTDTKIVEFNDNKVKFENSESIKLTLYSNGIALYNGPFRPFSQSITKKFCIDIMDGYFPSELQEKYPDGVRFDLNDKREIFFKQDKNSVFTSKGYRLGSAKTLNIINENQPNNLGYSIQQNGSEKNFESQLSENPMTIDQFLNKLPGNVIKNGKIYDVRNDVSSIIKGINSNAKDSESNLTELEKDEKFDNLQTMNSEKVATLKIKSLSNSDKPVVIKMAYTDTIKNLKSRIKSIKKYKMVKDFDIASIYPRKIFDDLQMTLEECDLVPNSNVLIIPKK